MNVTCLLQGVSRVLGPRVPLFTSSWKNLTVVTYAVPKEHERTLEKLLPPGCELDRWNGKAMVSVVAFDFSDAKAAGVVPTPGDNFPAVNFRFYAKRGNQHGVVFIRELGPSPVAGFVGPNLLAEPFFDSPVSVKSRRDGDKTTYERTFVLGGKQHQIRAEAKGPSRAIAPGSLEEAITQREWGFGEQDGKALIYSSKHPRWRTYPDSSFQVNIDFSSYGPEWAFLNRQKPLSILQADGSVGEIGFPIVAPAGTAKTLQRP